MEAIRNELVAAEASLETIKQRRLELAEQIAGKRKAGNNNTNLQQELKSTKETLKTATQQVAAAKAKQREQNAANQRNRNAANQRQRKFLYQNHNLFDGVDSQRRDFLWVRIVVSKKTLNVSSPQGNRTHFL